MDERFPIVGIGASAGGVEALEALFKAMPAEPGMAFVVVTHLAPKRESLLRQILARDTRIPVAAAEHDGPVRRNHARASCFCPVCLHGRAHFCCASQHARGGKNFAAHAKCDLCM